MKQDIKERILKKFDELFDRLCLEPESDGELTYVEDSVKSFLLQAIAQARLDARREVVEEIKDWMHGRELTKGGLKTFLDSLDPKEEREKCGKVKQECCCVADPYDSSDGFIDPSCLVHNSHPKKEVDNE